MDHGSWIMDPLTMPTALSACPFTRICELNEDEDNNTCHISLVTLGVRTHTAQSRAQAERFGVQVRSLPVEGLFICALDSDADQSCVVVVVVVVVAVVVILTSRQLK